jgi:hypothetical protein
MVNITPIQKHAFSWSDLHAEVNYLENLSSKGNLNDEQMDFVGGYIHHLNEKIEDLEFYLLETDEDGKYYQEVRHTANMLTVTPSTDFLNHVNSNISEMNMDDTEYQIKEAVEKYNSFFYSCAIYVNSFGYVDFNGCHMESDASATVIFNKRDKNKITIQDVKNRLTKDQTVA